MGLLGKGLALLVIERSELQLLKKITVAIKIKLYDKVFNCMGCKLSQDAQINPIRKHF
jgi:hypothetical protein